MPSYTYFLKLRYKAIFRNTGNIIIGLSVLILLVGSTAFIYDSFKDFLPFLITGILSFLSGGMFRFIGSGEKRKELNTQDAVVTVFLFGHSQYSFLLCLLFFLVN